MYLCIAYNIVFVHVPIIFIYIIVLLLYFITTINIDVTKENCPTAKFFPYFFIAFMSVFIFVPFILILS